MTSDRSPVDRGDPTIAVAAARLTRMYGAAGAAWAVVAALLALVLCLEIGVGPLPFQSVLVAGRVAGLYRFAALLGACSLPMAGLLLSGCGLAGSGAATVGRARAALWVWNAGLAIGAIGILAGWMSPIAWAPAPALAYGVIWLAAVLWSWALWSSLAPRGSRQVVAAWFAMAAMVGLLVYLGIAPLAIAGLRGAGQSLAGAIHGRGLEALWAALAAFGVAAFVLPTEAKRPLYGRRTVVIGLWSWIAVQMLVAPRDLAPDLLPTWLGRPVIAAAPLLIVPAAALAVALLGTYVGTPVRWPSAAHARFVAIGVATVLLGTMVQASLLPTVRRVVQFTPWDPVTGLLPPYAGLTLVAIGAGYALAGGSSAPNAAARHRHLVLAVVACGLLLAPSWPLGLAQAAGGPGADLLRLGALVRLPGVVALALSAVVWLANMWPRREAADSGSDVTGVVARTSEGLQPAAFIGTVSTLLVVGFFVTVFLPLVDRTYLAPTPRTAARVIEPGSLPATGRDVYASDGCVTCHTQRVRALPEDGQLGPPTRPGDYDAGPALAGLRRAGADLAWVGDRYPDRASLTASLQVHGPSSIAAHPALIDADGRVTTRGAALVDYLLRLSSLPRRVP